MKQQPHELVDEVIENHIWIGLGAWREAFVVPFINGTVPAWSDACFSPIQWDKPPQHDGDQGWQIVCSPATDADGWIYGTAFDHLRDDRPGGRASKRANDRVRSRLWRRLQQDTTTVQQGPHYSSTTDRLCSTATAAASAVSTAAGQSVSASRSAVSDAFKGAVAGATSAVQGAATAVQAIQSMPGAVKKASLSGMWATFSQLLKDAAERHNTAMITPDISGWFFVIGGHGEELKRQQISQLQHLVWFTAEPQLQNAMKPGGLGSNPPGVILPAGPALEAARKAAAEAAAAANTTENGAAAAAVDAAAAASAAGNTTAGDHVPVQAVNGSSSSSSSRDSTNGGGSSSSDGGSVLHENGIPGQPFDGVMLHLGSGSSSSSSSASKPKQRPEGSSTAAAAGAASNGLQLHVGTVQMLDELLAGARYSHAAYGYVAAAGHMSSIGSALKLLATLPLFDPITGVSLQANTQALMSLAGFDAPDVLLTAWNNDTFRPCHYVAVDRKRKCLVIGVRGSLEVGDLETDVTAAPLAFEFQGVAGWVHEGLLAAAAFVVSNTVDALAEAATRHPGWPLVVAGHSLGGGVAALVTLLLQQPGAAPRGISGIRCVCIGPAAVLSQELNEMCEEYITSVVVGADAIPRLSTYSVESLLLDLVNASVSKRVTSQLAATTSSVAASAAGAVNSITQGLSRLANQASNNVNNMAGALAGTLANHYITGSFANLTGLAGLPGPEGLPAGSTAGTSSAVITRSSRELEMARFMLERSAAVAEGRQPVAAAVGSADAAAPREGLKQLHDILRDEKNEQIRRKSFEEQQHQPRLLVEDAAAVAAAGAVTSTAGKVVATQQRARSRSPNRIPGKAVAQFGNTATSTSAAAAAAATAACRSAGSSKHSLLPFPIPSAADPSSFAQPQIRGSSSIQASTTTSSSSSSSSSSVATSAHRGLHVVKPGGAKLVTGSGRMIFPKMDDASIISGIQQACAELQQGSSSKAGRPTAAGSAAVAIGSPLAAAGQHPHSNWQVQTRQQQSQQQQVQQQHSQQQQHCQQQSQQQQQQQRLREPAPAMHRSFSSDGLHQWASDGLQPLGEPSWARLEKQELPTSQQSSHPSSQHNSGQQQQARVGKGEEGAGRRRSSDAGEKTVSALESDLKRTARLYPPGRIFWVLSEDLVGPAAHQLMSAVAAHLPKSHTPPPVAAAAAQASAASGGKARAEASASAGVGSARTHPETAAATAAAAANRAAAAVPVETSQGEAAMQAPIQEQMDMPTSLRGKKQQQQQQQQPGQQQELQAPQQQPSRRAVARNTATAHAVAAASAKHILEDVHSLDAKRTAVAALHAAQHEHAPLQLQQHSKPEDMAQQLLQQQQCECEDIAAASAETAVTHQEMQQQGEAAAPRRPQRRPQRSQQQQQSGPASVQLASFSRATSTPLEVDGSGTDFSGEFPDPIPQDLPPELQELLTILGSPIDAATALAIAHKKQLLLQHFWRQRRQDAAQEQQQRRQQSGQQEQDVGQGGYSSASRSYRTSSDSVLLKYEDMIASVDDGVKVVAAARSDGHADSQMELVSQSSRASSISDEAAAVAVQGWPPDSGHDKRPSSRGSGSMLPPVQRNHGRSQSWSCHGKGTSGTAGDAAFCASAGTSSDQVGTAGDSSGTGSPAQISRRSSRASSADGMWGLSGSLKKQQREEQQQQQQQQLQLSMFNESEEYVQWASQQAELHKQQQEREQLLKQQQEAENLSLQELAFESLIELAQLPQRFAESLTALRIDVGSGSSSSAAAVGPGTAAAGAAAAAAGAAAGTAAGCEESMLSALCVPVMGPAAAAGAGAGVAAAAGAAASASDDGAGRRLPVVVMPERDVFGKMLLYKTFMQDHLPSNYVRVLRELKEAYLECAH